MFKITQNKGFHLTFVNGITVSVQFERSNYCENYNKGTYDGPVEPSSTAEVMVWDKDGETLPIPNDLGELPDEADVCGHQLADDVARIVAHFASR